MIKDTAQQLKLRLNQLAQRADRLYCAVPGRFLAAEEQAMAQDAARDNGVDVSFCGGWSDA
ncbi:MAG: hypothetical protein Q4C54_02710 [Clostridia bacterium]|nr:hypothetical protein [Clostridia bacterium]